jgi:predicted RNA methylase
MMGSVLYQYDVSHDGGEPRTVRARTRQDGHQSEVDGARVVVTGPAATSATGALAKDLSFYRTPQAVVERMLAEIYMSPRSRVLEPSAGDGAIVRKLLREGYVVLAVEVDEGRAAQLQALAREWPPGRLDVERGNFLAYPTARPVAEAVVMNPPFYGTHWMEHVMHAFELLAPGGRLVSVLPASAEVLESPKHEAFRAWAKERVGRFVSLPAESFAESFAESGTRINTVLLTLAKAK